MSPPPIPEELWATIPPAAQAALMTVFERLERRSKAEAIRANPWPGAGIRCKDVMAGSIRGDRPVW